MKQFFQEDTGQFSSRRLIFILGSFLAIPCALLFGFFHPRDFVDIFEATLFYLGSCAGFATLNKFRINKTKK